MPDGQQWLADAFQRNHIDEASLRLVLALTLLGNANCIDVGAHNGEMLGEFVRLAPDGHQIAFEPIPALHAELSQKWPAVDCWAVALSDVSGEADFVYVPELSGYSGLRQQKIDVEGAELQVAARCHRHDPGPPAGDRLQARPSREVLVGAGLRVFDRDGQGPYGLAEFEDSCASDVRWNYLVTSAVARVAACVADR